MKPTNIYLGLIAILSVLMLIVAGAISANMQSDVSESSAPGTAVIVTTDAEITEPIPSEVISTEPITSEVITTEIILTEIIITEVERVPNPPILSPPNKLPQETTEEVIEEPSYINLTDSEKRILATIIRLEVGGSSYECQMAVASVVINRMNLWNLTLRQAVFQKNVFSTARHIDPETGNSNYPPYNLNWQVVEDICKNGPTLPYYVIYFRADYHHTWATPYCQIDSTYFSYAEKYK